MLFILVWAGQAQIPMTGKAPRGAAIPPGKALAACQGEVDGPRESGGWPLGQDWMAGFDIGNSSAPGAENAVLQHENTPKTAAISLLHFRNVRGENRLNFRDLFAVDQGLPHDHSQSPG